LDLHSNKRECKKKEKEKGEEKKSIGLKSKNLMVKMSLM